MGQYNNNKIYCFLFDNWFSYKLASDSTEDLGAAFIGTVKTIKNKGFEVTLFKTTPQIIHQPPRCGTWVPCSSWDRYRLSRVQPSSVVYSHQVGGTSRDIYGPAQGVI